MDENPHDKGCSTGSDCWADFISDLPFLVMSIVVLKREPMCEEYSKFSSLLWAFHLNGWVSVVMPVYHLAMSARRESCLTAMTHVITVTVAGIAIWFSQCTV